MLTDVDEPIQCSQSVAPVAPGNRDILFMQLLYSCCFTVLLSLSYLLAATLYHCFHVLKMIVLLSAYVSRSPRNKVTPQVISDVEQFMNSVM